MALGTKGGGSLSHYVTFSLDGKQKSAFVTNVFQQCSQSPISFHVHNNNNKQKGEETFLCYTFCFWLVFSFQLSRISRLFQNDEKEKLERFSRGRTIQKFAKEGIPNFSKIKKMRVADNLPPLFLWRRIKNNTHTLTHIHTHTHTQETKKKKERIMSRNGPVHLIFFFIL